jgi:hypothetical protein
MALRFEKEDQKNSTDLVSDKGAGSPGDTWRNSRTIDVRVGYLYLSKRLEGRGHYSSSTIHAPLLNFRINCVSLLFCLSYSSTVI